jgi:membrane protease YdiL (CAAX protease family)
MFRGLNGCPTWRESGPSGKRLTRESTPHDGRELRRLALLLGIFVPALAFSLCTGNDVFIFGYIVVCSFAIREPLHHNRPWKELGLKRGFSRDLRKVWYCFATEGVLFQILPPTLIAASFLGFYPQLLEHIAGRVSVDFSSVGGLSGLGVILAGVAVLTLVEEIVFRVTIQERLGWFIGAPAAILFASVLFSLVHAVGATGSPAIIFMDVLGVMIDGVLLGVIYAKTHNLALTWATHYTGDVIALIAMAMIL